MSAPLFSSFNPPPSFSSFPDFGEDSKDKAGPSKPSERETRDERDKSKRREYEDGKTKDRHRGHTEEQRDRDKRKDRRRSRSPRRSPGREERKHKSKSSRKLETHSNPTETVSSSIETNRIFYSDRRGDSMNIRYGGLHSGDIPRYHVVSNSKRVLGLPRSFVIYKRAGKGVEIGVTGQRKVSSLTDSSSRALLAQPPTKRLQASSDPSKYEDEDGIIRLPSRKRTQKPEESYRSITTAKDDSDSDSTVSDANDSASDSDDDDEESRPTLSAQQEAIARLSQALDADPTSVPTWLSLLRANLNTIPLSSKNATQARADITLSILSRALAAHPSNAHNQVLRMSYLKAGEEVWHESKLKAEWEGAFKAAKGVEDMDILMEWFEWRIRKGGGVDGVVDAARRVGEKIGESGGEEGDVGRLRVFWRAAEAIRSAGYVERAMAMFQAQAELIFFPPTTLLNSPFSTKLNSLEEFWDSEVPRIGEENALGWSTWVSSQSQSSSTPSQRIPPTPAPPPAPVDLDPYRQWAAQERLLDTHPHSVMPSRSDAEMVDPYAMVLFADVRGLLVDLNSGSTTTSVKGKSLFRMVWLSFLGLSVPGLDGLISGRSGSGAQGGMGWDDRWNLSHVVRGTQLSNMFPSDATKNALLTDAVAGAIVGREREYASAFGGLKSWGYGVLDPLDVGADRAGRGVWGPDDVAGVDEAVVRRLFRGLRVGGMREDEEWDVLGLAFELGVNSKTATKASKKLLSSNQGNLALWDAHAQLERHRGRLDDARKVYQTVLIASKTAGQGASRLWWHWAEMEWLDGKEEQALNVVLRAVGVQGAPSGVALLRAKRAMEDRVGEVVRGDGGVRWKEVVDWVRLRALLELLTTESAEAALGVFDRYAVIGGEGMSEAYRECIAVSSLLLLYRHGTILRRPTPPLILRERAHAAFEVYPSNSIVLGMVLEAEKGQGVWGRLRAMLGGEVDERARVKGVTRRLEEVWVAGWEKGRWVGEVERTRGGLEVAVEHERTRGSPVVWRVFIEFEIRVGELGRAKKLLFRAIGDCPMVKELYLLAFGPLRSVFAAHELNALADTMAERGLRLHQGLDEVVDAMDIADGNNGDDDRIDDEIEYNASELRRLKPY